MKIIATSDFHGSLPAIPECDLLLIGGDVCPIWEHGVRFQLKWLDTTFRSWLEQVPATTVVGIAGNHDFVFEKCSAAAGELELPWVYLQDSACEVEGTKVWGVPWVPDLPCWAFHLDDAGLDRKFDAIPNDTDIIVSHGPPRGYLDKTCPRYGSVHVGSEQLNDAMLRVKPRTVVCGHIHEGYGVDYHPAPATIYNVSHVTEDYKPINPPVDISCVLS